LTEERILIKSGISSKSIQSINIKALSNIELIEKADGTGTISLGPNNTAMGSANGMDRRPRINASPQLEMIANAKKVYRQIIELQNKL